jgi:hypothetical protein
MAIGSSVAGQVGFAVETTAGTRIAPAKWAVIDSESLTAAQNFVVFSGVGGGTAFKPPGRVLGKKPAGDIKMIAAAESMPTLLKLCFGAPATTGPVSTVYTHTYNWLLTNALPTATFQIGRPDKGGTVRPFDYIGMMVSTWGLDITPNDWVRMTYHLEGTDAKTDQTLGTPTWPTLTPWVSTDCTLSIMGGTECFDSLSLNGDNKLDMSDVVCGTNPGMRRVRQAGGPDMGGTFTQDFEDLTMLAAFQAGTVGDLTLTLTSAVAPTSAVLTITGRVQYVEDNSPAITGQDTILKQQIPFKFVRDGSNTDAQAFSAVLKTTVATA